MTEKLSNDSLNKLLIALSTQSEDPNIAYTKLRDSLVRFFQIKGDGEPDTAADETLDRLAVKVSQNVEITDVTNYGFGIARLIFLERLKQAKKDKIATTNFYQGRILTEIDENEDDFAGQRDCFEKLPDEEKELLRKYFTDLPFYELRDYREKLCVELNLSLNNLRLKIFRLRQRLDECVKRKLN